MSVTVEGTSARVCAGVDWAKDDHAICVLDDEGRAVDRFAIEHTASGLKRLIARLLKADGNIAALLKPAEIDAMFDDFYHLKHVDAIFERVFGPEL